MARGPGGADSRDFGDAGPAPAGDSDAWWAEGADGSAGANRRLAFDSAVIGPAASGADVSAGDWASESSTGRNFLVSATAGLSELPQPARKQKNVAEKRSAMPAAVLTC